jgi:hypothetical protein
MLKRIIIITVVLFCINAYIQGDEDITIEKDYFVYNAATKQFLPTVDSAVANARRRLVNILGDTLRYKPSICIKDNVSDFKECIGSAIPDWGAAAALPYRELIAIKSPAHFKLGKSLAELVAHEYAHLCLHDRIRPLKPPRWVDEGLAMYIAYEWGWSGNFAMSRATVFNTLIPLKEIDNINRFSHGKAQTAYAESYLAIKYLLDEYGKESFIELLNSYRRTRSADSAMLASVGGTVEEFEKEFFDNLKKRYNVMSLFGDLYFIWIFLALVVFFGALIKFLRRKKYYDKWDEEDKLQSRDFDYGDPDNPEQIDDEDEPWR